MPSATYERRRALYHRGRTGICIEKPSGAHWLTYRGPEGLVSGEECMLQVYKRRHTTERMGRIDRLARALDGKPRLHKMDGRFASHASFRPL